MEMIQLLFNKTIILKNGQTCLLRNCEGSDAKAVIDSFNLTHGQTEFLLSYPNENSFTVEQERNFLVKKNNSPNEIELCAIIDGKIVGTAGIDAIGTKYKVKHRADLGISVEKDYWGLGIGRALLEACITCAKEAGYTQLELTVVADNTSAISLYKSLGFIEFGRNPKGFLSRTVGYQELVLMYLPL